MDRGVVRDKIREISSLYRHNSNTLAQALQAYVENLIDIELRQGADEIAKRYCDRQCEKPAGLMCRACFNAIAARVGRNPTDLMVERILITPSGADSPPIEVEPLSIEEE